MWHGLAYVVSFLGHMVILHCDVPAIYVSIEFI